MKRFYILLIALAGIILIYTENLISVELPSVHTFFAKTIDGEEKALRDYKGKVLLIVNVASKCGYTHQYEGLQKLYNDYKDKGFEILAFPSNQFAGQEPGTNEEIKTFCKENYGVYFSVV